MIELTSGQNQLENRQACNAVDLDGLCQRTGGDQELLAELVQLFMEDLPDRRSELQSAVAARNPRALELAAHALKGMVRNFTDGPAYTSALRLEQMGRGGDLNCAEVLLSGLEREVEDLQAALLGLVEEAGQ